MKHVSQITAAFITPECRARRGEAGAWDEAVDRLREEYEAVLDGWRGRPDQPTLNLVLEFERVTVHPASNTPSANPRSHTCEFTGPDNVCHICGAEPPTRDGPLDAHG